MEAVHSRQLEMGLGQRRVQSRLHLYQPVGGWWVDRVGVRKGLLISTIIWGAGGDGAFVRDGVLDLVLLADDAGAGRRTGHGGDGQGNPPTDAARRRDMGNGLMNAGWAIGALISPLVVEPISRRYGWQAAFLFTGGLCFMWIPLWVMLSWRRSPSLCPAQIDLSSAAIIARGGSTFARSPCGRRWRRSFSSGSADGVCEHVSAGFFHVGRGILRRNNYALFTGSPFSPPTSARFWAAYRFSVMLRLSPGGIYPPGEW